LEKKETKNISFLPEGNNSRPPEWVVFWGRYSELEIPRSIDFELF
jgi:hypothetical protein